MLTVNGAAFSAELKIIETAVLSEIPNIAKNVSREALRRAQDGLERSVYGTVPGRVYVRTGTLRRSVTVRILPRVNSISLELYARAPYASDIEYGSNPAMSEATLTLIAEATGGQVTSFGRSGRHYTLPGPFLLPASMYALEQARIEFEQVLVKHWR